MVSGAHSRYRIPRAYPRDFWLRSAINTVNTVLSRMLRAKTGGTFSESLELTSENVNPPHMMDMMGFTESMY
jgi:hypothetical protein